MWEKWLLPSIALFSLIGGAKSQPEPIPIDPEDSLEYEGVPLSDPIKLIKCDYILSVLTVLRSEKTGLLCVSVDSEEAVKVVVTFEFNSIQDSVFNEQINANARFFECRKISVPKVDETTLAYVTILIKGDTVDKNERKAVAIDKMREGCTYQMDKKMYLPGDTVKFRMFCINDEFKPVAKKCAKIYLVESNGVRAAQMEEPMQEHDVTTGEFTLDEEAATGYYRIQCVTDSEETEEKYFEVMRYELPRFDSHLSCPSAISVQEESAEIKISARYIYDKPFHGTVIGKCCRSVAYRSVRERNCLRGLEDICVEFTKEVESGTCTENMNLDTFKLSYSEYDNSVQCTITLKEAETGVLDTKYCYIYITKQPINLQFEYYYYYPYYRRGIHYPIRCLLTNEKGDPMANEVIVIEVDGKQVKKVKTDAKGRAECLLDTLPYFKPNLTITASYQNEDICYSADQSPWFHGRYAPYDPYPYNPEYPFSVITVYRLFAESDCYLQIKRKTEKLGCFQNHTIEVQYRLTEDGVGIGKSSVPVICVVKSRQSVPFHGQYTIDMTRGLRGSFHVDVPITHEYDLRGQFLCWAGMKTEIISDSIDLAIEPCTKNQVSLDFAEPIVAPGAEVQQNLTAAPGSVCFLRAWDASLDILRSYDEFNIESMYYLVQYYTYGFQVNSFDLADPTPPCEDPNSEVFCEGRYRLPVSRRTDGYTYNDLMSLGMTVMSNLRTQKPHMCGMEEEEEYHPGLFKSFGGTVGFAGAAPEFADIAAIETNRDKFSPTFGWQAELIGPDGKATATSTCPDAITKWRSDMACMSKEQGLGLTSRAAEVTTFLSFFGETTMPLYCTRGETVIVVVTAVNNLEKCVKVRLVLVESPDYEMQLNSDAEDIFLRPGERGSKEYSIKLISLGEVEIQSSVSTTLISDSCNGPNDESEPPRIDTTTRIMKVEPEGMPRETVFSFLDYLREESTAENTVMLEVPENVVSDSITITLSVTGDIIGNMAENYKNLMRQPSGCCDHNLAQILAIYDMINYFKATEIADEELHKKAHGHLCSYYNSHLPCRRWDGQYTTFPDSQPNHWILAQTILAFEMLRDKGCYVYKSIQEQALLELGKLQNETTGCFTIDPQGDQNNDAYYTAFVVLQLQQCKNLYGIGEPILRRGMECLQAVDPATMELRTVAHVFHFAALANLDNLWDSLATIVKSQAIQSGSSRFWPHDPSPPVNTSPLCSSSEVVIAANILSGFLSRSEVDQDYTAPIASFVSSCMNSKGGYVSAQATISAIRALTAYGRLVFIKDPNCKVVASQGGAELASISVNEGNKLLAQKLPLPVTSGEVNLTVTGKCAAMVQVIYKFHTQVKKDNSSFSLVVTPRSESCTEGVTQLIFNDICTKYTGSRSATNAVYMQIRLLTGYFIDYVSFYQLKRDNLVSHVRIRNNDMYLFWDSLEQDKEVCFTVMMSLQDRVSHYKTAIITMEDYSNPDESASASYSNPCSPIAEVE